MELEALLERVLAAVVGVAAGPSHGSGFFVDPTGLLVTNYHVIGSETEVIVHASDGQQLSGRVLLVKRSVDLAFIRTAAARAPGALSLAPRSAIKLGQDVLAIGSPQGLRNSVSRGIVSAIARTLSDREYVQTDAAINPGNSGGPLITRDGLVVGVATLGLSDQEGRLPGLNFAVPSYLVETSLSTLRERLARYEIHAYCNVCGWLNPGDEVYCENCGARFREEPVAFERQHRSHRARAESAAELGSCHACGGGIGESAMYCPRCGAKRSGGDDR